MASPYRFIFITGIEGSGTTMLTRILSAMPGVVGLGGNHISVPRSDRDAFPLVKAFNEANQQCWDRHASFDAARAGRTRMRELVDELRAVPAYAETTHVLYKRSAPFLRVPDGYRPDLLDIDDTFDEVRFVLIYRDPRAATASAIRRGFFEDVRRAAVVHEEQLTYLNGQLNAIPPERVHLMSYERFCHEPSESAGALSTFTGIDHGALLEAIEQESPDPGREELWRGRLDTASVAFLDSFFDERRCRQWPRLDATRLARV